MAFDKKLLIYLWCPKINLSENVDMEVSRGGIMRKIPDTYQIFLWEPVKMKCFFDEYRKIVSIQK